MTYKGGISLYENHTKIGDFRLNNVSAIHYFLQNSTFSVLTNDSLSCITLLVKLNNHIESPFVSFRYSSFNKPIKILLMKLFLVNMNRDFYEIEGRHVYNGIRVTSYFELTKECEIQEDVYRRSFYEGSNLFDPLCPAILGIDVIDDYENYNGIDFRHLPTSNDRDHNKLKFNLLKILDGSNVHTTKNTDNNKVAVIFMEFMEHFHSANKLIGNEESASLQSQSIFERRIQYDVFYIYIMQYELQLLTKLGYKHGDSHFGNIMINPKQEYYSKMPSILSNMLQQFTTLSDIEEYLKKYNGRASILDYGLTVPYSVSEHKDILDSNKELYKHIRDEKLYKYVNAGHELTNAKFNIILKSRIKIVIKSIAKLRSMLGDDMFEKCIYLFREKRNSIIDPSIDIFAGGEIDAIGQHKTTKHNKHKTTKRISTSQKSNNMSYINIINNNNKTISKKPQNKLKISNVTEITQELDYKNKYSILAKLLTESQKKEMITLKNELNHMETEKNKKEIENLNNEIKNSKYKLITQTKTMNEETITELNHEIKNNEILLQILNIYPIN